MQESIREVVKTLFEAVLLVVLVMFLFLQSWRATIIPALTLPVALVGTFAFVKLLGFSINTLTLFAIVLSTGIVVDDAIVVIENIERHIQDYGKRAARAASDAMTRGVRRRHRDVARARLGFRAGGVLPGHDGPSLRAVRADHRVRRRAVDLQRAHPDACAVGAPAPRRGGQHGKGRFFGPIEAVDPARHRCST